MNTKKAFSHFLEHCYPDIKPKPDELRQAKIRFKQGKLSEERMTKLLNKYGYKPKTFKKIPETWKTPIKKDCKK